MITTQGCLGGIAAIGFVWFWGLLILVSTTVHGRALAGPVTLLALMLALILIGIAARWKRLVRVAGWIAALAVLIIAALTGYFFYLNSVPVISEQGVALNQYEPFSPNAKLVRLPCRPEQQLSNQDLPCIDGATELYPVYAAFAEAVYPRDDYPHDILGSQVKCSSTNEAYDLLIEGRVQLIFCLRPSKEQAAKAAKAGLTFELTPIGREALVFFVNAKNPVSGLTTAQIRGIYSGKITNFAQVGGPSEPILAYQRPQGSGSQTRLETIMGDTPLIAPPESERLDAMGDIIRDIADYKNFRNAIGFSFLHYTQQMVWDRRIKLLAIDGVTPSAATIRDGSYPLITEFYAITARPRTPQTRALIDWILSPEGQYIVEKTGCIPIADSRLPEPAALTGGR